MEYFFIKGMDIIHKGFFFYIFYILIEKETLNNQ